MALETPRLVTPVPNQKVALRGTRLSVTLAGQAQKAAFEQTFVNQDAVAIEALYTFPLPNQAAVCGFEVVTGDHVLTGQVDEAEAALERYDDAISAGHGAFLLEQNRPDVFTVNVGDLKPGQAATVKVAYVAPLVFQERRLRLAYPTTIAPRYVTASGQTDPIHAEIDGDVVNPPHVLCVPYGLTLTMAVRLGRALRAVTSPTHDIRCEQGTPDQATVTLAAGVTEMDRDLVVEVETVADSEPVAQAGTGPDGQEAFLAVTFLPELDPAEVRPPTPQAVTFLLDCSGSMQGESIAQARRALDLCLRSLNLGDRFNLGRFGSRFEFMSPAPLEYGEATLAQASAYLARAEADLGGTEVFGALEAVFAQPAVGGGLHAVILLTDGQVSNEAALIRLAEAHAASHRVFTFGIGSACSHHLVQGLAAASRGAAEFISGDERIEEKVLRTFSRIGSPLATDLRIDWGAARALPAPASVPPLFDGEPLTAYAAIDGEVPATVTLTCRLGGTPREWRVPVTRVADGGLIAQIWARSRLRELEGALPAERRYHHPRSASPQERRDGLQVVALSKRFGVLCSRTCFVAVEHRSPAERNEGRPELRRIPLQLARGWHGIEPAAASGVLGASRTGVRSRGASYHYRSVQPPPFPLAEDSGGFTAQACLARCAPYAVPSRLSAAGRAREAMPAGLELLASQSAAGWFAWSSEFDAFLARVPGGSAPLRSRLVQAFSLDGRPDRGVLLDTLLVLWLLQYQYNPVWRLGLRAVRKAVHAVGDALGMTPEAVQQRLDALAPTPTP